MRVSLRIYLKIREIVFFENAFLSSGLRWEWKLLLKNDKKRKKNANTEREKDGYLIRRTKKRKSRVYNARICEGIFQTNWKLLDDTEMNSRVRRTGKASIKWTFSRGSLASRALFHGNFTITRVVFTMLSMGGNALSNGPSRIQNNWWGENAAAAIVRTILNESARKIIGLFDFLLPFLLSLL